MLSIHLQRFNEALQKFQKEFPRKTWSEEFKTNLVNDFSFFSSRIEDSKLEYGDTLKFLKDEWVKKENLTSLLQINNHKKVLNEAIDRYDDFKITEDTIKAIHKNLMGNELSWNGAVMMKNGCPPVFAQILNNTDMEQYINTIIACEMQNSNEPFIEFLANGISEYLGKKSQGN